MFEIPVGESITRAVAAIREAASSASLQDRADVLTAVLRGADALVAAATELVARGAIAAVEGRPVEQVLRTEAGYTYPDAAMLAEAAAIRSRMPALRVAFDGGLVSWGQVRSIIVAVRRTPVAHRPHLDQLIGEHAKRLAGADSDRLIALVDDEIARLQPQRTVASEDRMIRSSFLAIQARLDGGAAFYGEADAVAAATIVDALDAIADDPVHPERGTSRAEQRFDALLHMCETTLAGENEAAQPRLRPRPRLLATIDIAGLQDAERDEAMQLLWALPGRAPRLSRVTRNELLCDASIVPIIFNGHTVIAAGDETTTFSNKVRTAILARDQRCRMCSHAPASWADAHHLVPGKGNSADDGCLLCRRCHRTVHRYNWTITPQDHGILKFQRRGKHFLSHPP